MADEVVVDADSTPAPSESTPASGQAPSPPAVTPAPPQYRDFSQHPDWQKMVAERRQERGIIGTLQQKLAEYERAAQKPASPATPRTPEETFQRTQAVAALKELIGEDPDLKGILDLVKMAPQLQGVTQHVNGLRQSQYRATVQAGHEAIRQIAQENHLPAEMVNGPAFDHLEDLITGVFTRNPDLAQRFLNGERDAVKEAWKKLDPFIGALRKPAVTGVVQTKRTLATLPPGPRGGAPGPSAPPAFDAANPRKAIGDLHNQAEALLKERLAAAGAS